MSGDLRSNNWPKADLGQGAGISALATLNGLEDRACLCFSMSPPAALPGMCFTTLGTVEEVGLIRFLLPFLETLPAPSFPQWWG